MPGSARFLPQLVTTADGAVCQGILCSSGGESTVVMIMHPREYLPNNYLVPEILQGGAATWTQAPRAIGSDLKLEHETALHDVAGGILHLRRHGFTTIILAGLSGGASLFSFYQEQANLSPADRIQHSPSGRRTRLGELPLPPADGVMLVSPHPGQGVLLMNALDPSVIDEGDPLRTDESLDPFSKANGFRTPPNPASYAPDFIRRYRKAQKSRVARIDEWAHEVIARRTAARARVRHSANFADQRDSVHSPIRTVWRTDADLRCFDLTIEPTNRAYGSLWGGNPIVSNYGAIGFARLVTAESWLSTWSGISSNAVTAHTAAGITQPTIVIRYTGDSSVFPKETATIVEALACSDKEYHTLPGDHHGRPLREADADGQLLAGELLRDWLKRRFP